MFVSTAPINHSSGNSNAEVMDQRSQQQQQGQGQGAGVMPGFRFHPTDEELVGYYLRRQAVHRPPAVDVITQLDIYKFDPWDLPNMSALKGEKEWYFFCPRDRKYRNSTRPNRVTGAGFWKATGTDRPIYSSDAKKCIGLKKSLVFYTGRAAKSTKTDWMMHEFRMPASAEASTLGRVQGDEIALQQVRIVGQFMYVKARIPQQQCRPGQLKWDTKPQLHDLYSLPRKDPRTPYMQAAEVGFSPVSWCTASGEQSFQDTWAVCKIFKKSTLAQRHSPPCQQWEITEPHQFLIGASQSNFVMPGSECISSPELDHDTSSQERSDTTSEDLDVEGSMQRTTQDIPPTFLSSRGYAGAATHVQQPQQQLKQEQTTATWPTTIANNMEELLQDTSSVRRTVLPQRSHIPSDMYPSELQNFFVQDQLSTRGALDYVSCIINPCQSGSQFVGSNFGNHIQSGESMKMINSLENAFSWVEPRMNTPLDIYRKELTHQIPHQRQVTQTFISTDPWD